MFYLIQKMLFKDNHHQLLTDYLDKRGLDYELVRFMPFIHEIEFQTKRKDIWCWGSPNMGLAAKKYGWTYGSMINDNHDFEVQLKYYGENMLNHDGHVIEFTDILPTNDNIFFARPTKDSKIFTGQVFTQESWKEYVNEVSSNNDTYLISNESKILVSNLKNIQQEIRCWIVNGEVVTMSLYRMGGRPMRKNYDNEEPALNFVKKMVNIFQPAKAFVMDICLIDNVYKIVEINLINASGFYEANIEKIINAIEESFN